jgi:hypothetical protein
MSWAGEGWRVLRGSLRERLRMRAFLSAFLILSLEGRMNAVHDTKGDWNA